MWYCIIDDLTYPCESVQDIIAAVDEYADPESLIDRLIDTLWDDLREAVAQGDHVEADELYELAKGFDAFLREYPGYFGEDPDDDELEPED